MKTVLHQLKWGNFNLIQGDMISDFACTYGEWSEVEVAFFHDILTEQSNIVEVGANLGLHTIPLAKKANKGKLFCFEPQRIIFQLLCGNITMNNLTNVYAYQQGVGREQSKCEIHSTNYNESWNYGSFSLDKSFSTEQDYQGEIETEQVDIICLDKHQQINQLDSLTLLKVDAEGFDLQVLQGAEKVIAKYQPIIFIEAHFYQAPVLIRYLNQLNYQCYWFISDRYQTNNFFRQPKTLTGLDVNLACFPCKNNVGGGGGEYQVILLIYQ
ncbi:FkbM family methyltransferase [Volucribacter amazonae]|uniref:Methyltransferase FkbM domain-containing protein n=1 Tax=Volucribacter amazonae TaxID=256731 RepID=A0A9X4PCI7_9PAST|nr:FkbM family methyltransferase [Volucribacter amazonae]MDG6895652.1 hypothetical protein [Volucribacter amazonae]